MFSIIGTGLPNDTEIWKGTVSVGGIVLVDSVGTLEDVVNQLISKLEKMSQKMLALRISQHPPPPSVATEDIDSSGIFPAETAEIEKKESK